MDQPTLSELIRRRDAGYIRIGVVRTWPKDDLASALSRLGIRYRGERCREVGSGEATRILSGIFSKDLAYGGELIPEAEATRFAEYVLRAVFPPDAKLLTNVDELEPLTMFQGSYGSFFHGTEATFEVGLIAVTEAVIACVWVEDED